MFSIFTTSWLVGSVIVVVNSTLFVFLRLVLIYAISHGIYACIIIIIFGIELLQHSVLFIITLARIV